MSRGVTGTWNRSSMQFSSRLVPRQAAGFMVDSYISKLEVFSSGAAAFGA